MTRKQGYQRELAPPERWPEILRWIHRDLCETAEVRVQHALQTLKDAKSHGVVGTVRSEGELSAAIYAALLPGQVASIGGLRIDPVISQDEATQLIEDILDYFSSDRVELFQALADGFETSEREALSAAGFEFLAFLDHMVLSLDKSTAGSCEEVIQSLQLPDGLQVTRYQESEERLLESLIVNSYIDTLDCPRLGNGRSGKAAMDGYLASRDQPHSWWIARREGEAVGCLLLWEKIPEVWELTYMGIVPAARGNRLGELLLEVAIGVSAYLGARQLILSVDRGNAPANRIYENRRFDCYNSTEVWFRQGLATNP
jgi:ribosomal protein S18 acetylase RimI-like enzyme